LCEHEDGFLTQGPKYHTGEGLAPRLGAFLVVDAHTNW